MGSQNGLVYGSHVRLGCWVVHLVSGKVVCSEFGICDCVKDMCTYDHLSSAGFSCL